MRRTFARLAGARSRALGGPSPCVHPGPVRIVVLVVLLAACGGAQHRARPTTGAIAGLARDHDSGDPVAKAQIRVRATGELQPRLTVSSDRGEFDIRQLPPGHYQLSALFAGQPIEVSNIDVRAGETTTVDVTFTLGRPDPIRVEYNDPKASVIDRYRPPHLGASVAIIEGTVNDTQTRERVPGAVITAVGGSDPAETQQTITDDRGRFRFDSMRPGTYSVSAYYSITGRGQIEVRRSDIAVVGAEAVVVPLWIELVR